MNKSFEEGKFPDIWKIANVIPIFKAAESATFDLLILALMFIFFKNTVKN